jgi:hypothetical protein
MKLKTILIILIVFFILSSISSPYKKRVTKKKKTVATVAGLHIWPTGVIVNIPTSKVKLDPSLQTFYQMLRNFVNQLKTSSFTQSLYSDTDWNMITSRLTEYQNTELANFVSMQNKYANDPNILTYCDYLSVLIGFAGDLTIMSYALNSNDPGCLSLINGEVVTQAFANFIQTLITKADC